MTKREAIRLLTEQKQIFESRTYSDREVWRQKTGSLIEQFLGKDSNEYYSFAKFEFGVLSYGSDKATIKQELDRKHSTMVDLLNNYIDKLKTFGLYKKPQQNIVYHLDNWKLITIAVVLFVSGLTAGIWLKENTSLVVFPSIEKGGDNNSNSKAIQAETK